MLPSLAFPDRSLLTLIAMEKLMQLLTMLTVKDIAPLSDFNDQPLVAGSKDEWSQHQAIALHTALFFPPPQRSIRR